MSEIPRYAPARAFPPYAFLPGVNPHPRQNPEGHSYGLTEELAAEAPDPALWQECEAYLFGIDLYNHGYLWEAHEAWEGIWHPAKQSDPELAAFLQGLILCTASSLKQRMGDPRGRGRLAENGTGKLMTVGNAHGGTYMGLDAETFATDFRAFTAGETDDRPLMLVS